MASKKLSRSEIIHIANLANLNLSEKEIGNFQKQFAEVLDYIDQLKQLDTSKIEPTSQVTGLENVFRSDEIEQSLSQEKALSGTKSTNNGYFKVKAIFEEKF